MNEGIAVRVWRIDLRGVIGRVIDIEGTFSGGGCDWVICAMDGTGGLDG